MNEKKSAGVIGHPVAHSLSPQIFEFLSRKTGIPVEYTKIDVSQDELPGFVQGLRKKTGFVGCNVTIPHKEIALGLVDELSDEARDIGALNVIKILAEKLKGFNTDAFGIVETLKENEVQKVKGNSIIFGAGGAARSAVYALAQLGAAEITLVNRSVPRAEKVIADLKKVYPAVKFSVLSFDDIIPASPLYINATSIGMEGTNGYFSLPKNLIKGTICFDIVYNRQRTPFLQEADLRGAHAVEGLHMLIWQAIRTFEIWFKELSEKVALKKELYESLV